MTDPSRDFWKMLAGLLVAAAFGALISRGADLWEDRSILSRIDALESSISKEHEELRQRDDQLSDKLDMHRGLGAHPVQSEVNAAFREDVNEMKSYLRRIEQKLDSR